MVIEYVCVDLDVATISPSPPIKAFMDDLYLQADSTEKAQNLLNRANEALTWARMKLKPCKSKCLIISKGQLDQDKTLSINYENKIQTIPSIKNNPVKFLGRKISFSLKDKDQIEAFSTVVSQGLTLIDKSFHRGVHKVWILQHLLIPRLRWPLLIYEIPISTKARLEQKISCFIRKWLRLHKSTSNICLYSSPSPFHCH